MGSITALLFRINAGDSAAEGELFTAVYDQLRTMAARQLSREMGQNCLDSTALVHEVYLRMIGNEREQIWQSRKYFFGAVAESMRRILIEQARARQATKRGGGLSQQELQSVSLVQEAAQKILLVHEGLEKLESCDPLVAELVRLRFFAGYTIPEAAKILEISARKANQLWAYGKAWLTAELAEESRE